jgi:hypothetical protein
MGAALSREGKWPVGAARPKLGRSPSSTRHARAEDDILMKAVELWCLVNENVKECMMKEDAKVIRRTKSICAGIAVVALSLKVALSVV